MGSQWTEIFELKCLTKLQTVSPVAWLIGAVSIPLCLFMPVPQYYKLSVMGSAAGLSSSMLLLGNLGRALNMINLFILHFDQGLTNNTRRGKLYFGLASQIFVIALAASPIYILFKAGKCAPVQTYANVIGFFNTVFLCMQYVPQIVLTLSRREVGAVSYLMYFPDVVGGYLMTVEKAFGTHERISTWLPYLLMHTLEFLMVALNAVYDEPLRAKIADVVGWRKSREVQASTDHYGITDDEREREAIMKRDEVEHSCKSSGSVTHGYSGWMRWEVG